MDQEIRDYIDRVVAHERELREATERSAMMALNVQTKELARRLEDLNHAHQRSLEDRGAFVPREAYEVSQREFATWRETINGQVRRAEGAQQGSTATLAMVVGGLSLLIALGGLAVSLLR